MIVVLLGYMGSGKSTTGRLLAEKLGFDFKDLDDYIEAKQMCSISSIFKSEGEIYFRKIEATSVKELCSKNDSLVLALGGGTPCYSDTMSYLVNNSKVVTVMLNTSVANLASRLVTKKSKRPLISALKNGELKEYIAKHLFERSFFYSQAEASVLTDNLNQKELVERIINELF